MKKIILLLSLMIGFSFSQLFSQDANQYSWVPKGGCAILESLNRGDLKTIVTQKKSAAEWEKFFSGAGLPEKEVKTLAAYLWMNMPLAAPANQLNCAKTLPPDGRTIFLKTCQGCHTIGPILSQERTVVGWFILLEGSAHELDLSEETMQAMADYFVINNPVPEEMIPKVHNQPIMP